MSKIDKLRKSRIQLLFRNMIVNPRRKSLPPRNWKSKVSFKSYGLLDFLTCAYINFSENKYSHLKRKDINVVEEKQSSYCFVDLQKEAYL